MPDFPNGDLLLTGATGFVGGVLLRRLLAMGVPAARLRVLARDRVRAAALGLPSSSIVGVDFADPAGGPALLAAAAGVQTVVHLAGSLKGYRRDHFDRVNVDGTARLVAAVRQAAPDAHVVCVSSLAAAGPSVDGAGSASPPDLATPVSWYGDSKRRGELAVVGSGLPFTIVRPPVVYGPGDAATRLLFAQACAPVVVVPPVPRPLSVVHVDDVVAALVLACSRRPPGAIVPLDGPDRTDTHALLRAIASACGRRARLLQVPLPIAGVGAALADLWARLRARPGFFSRDKMKEIAACGWVADGSAAQRHLGFTPQVRLVDGLAAVAQRERAGAAN